MSNHEFFIVYGYTFYGLPKRNNSRTINVCLIKAFKQCCVFLSNACEYLQYNITGIIVYREMVYISLKLVVFHTLNCKVFWNISQNQWILFYFRVICFKLMHFFTINIQKHYWMHCSVDTNKFYLYCYWYWQNVLPLSLL